MNTATNLKSRILNTIKNNPGIYTTDLASRYPSLTRPKIQQFLFELNDEKRIKVGNQSSRLGNSWEVIPLCKGGWHYHVYTLGASGCSMCGYGRY